MYWLSTSFVIWCLRAVIVVRQLVCVCCYSLNTLGVYWAWNCHIAGVSPLVTDLMINRTGGVGADPRSVELVYANPFALVKSVLVMTRAACPRSIFGVGTEIEFSLITSWNIWRGVYVGGILDVEMCGMS